MGPVWKRDINWMKTALRNWHREMVSVGLATDEEAMERFIWTKTETPSPNPE